jgi:hypothetical protein
LEHTDKSEVYEKAIRNEKRSVELWGVLLGLLLWLAFYGVFYASGLYATWGRSLFLGSFYGSDPTVAVLFITLPLSIAVLIASVIGAIKVARKVHNIRPFKVAIADSVDLFLWGNSFAIWAGMVIHYTLDSLYQSISVLGLVISQLLAFLPPIVGFPFILDFLMPRFWRSVFGYSYGYFQGKLLKNLRRSWRKGYLQRDSASTC